MVTALLLLPVIAVLIWLYWYLLPARKWLPSDSMILLSLLAVATVYVLWVERMNFDEGGPMWPYIVSAAGTYGILTMGMGMALAWRRHRAKN